MKNKMITQRRYKVEQRGKMVAVMAAIFFVLCGAIQTNVVNVRATSLDSDVANDDFDGGTAVTGGTCRIIGEDGSYEVLLWHKMQNYGFCFVNFDFGIAFANHFILYRSRCIWHSHSFYHSIRRNWTAKQLSICNAGF